MEIYPVTICQDRYNGAYSHGLWLAFRCDTEEVPTGPWESDSDCMNWWYAIDLKRGYQKFIGKGDTPNDALEDLEKQIDDNKFKEET